VRPASAVSVLECMDVDVTAADTCLKQQGVYSTGRLRAVPCHSALTCCNISVLLRRPQNPIANLLVGGTAGIIAASACYPLDTIRRRMQVRRGFLFINEYSRNLCKNI
jgi:hypothetical protein